MPGEKENSLYFAWSIEDKETKVQGYLFFHKGKDKGEARRDDKLALLFPCALSLQCGGHGIGSSLGRRWFLA